MSEVFVITGVVRERESKRGIPGLIIHAYDKDVLHDDLMGEDRTSFDGSFRITSEAGKFQDFFDTRPEIYLRIMVPGRHGALPREIFTTAHAVQWDAGHSAYIVIEIPYLIAHDLPSEEDRHGYDGGSACP